MRFKVALTVLTILCAISIAGAELGTSTAEAHAPWKHQEGELYTPKRHFLKYLRVTILHERNERCLKQPNLRPVWSIPREQRDRFISKWLKSTLPVVKARESRCLPTNPEAIIRYVFPAATEDRAVAVADCESGLYPRAKNPVSSASGLFQLLSFHWAGKFDPFDPWENTRYAYRLSDAGYNWSAWVCQG